MRNSIAENLGWTTLLVWGKTKICRRCREDVKGTLFRYDGDCSLILCKTCFDLEILNCDFTQWKDWQAFDDDKKHHCKSCGDSEEYPSSGWRYSESAPDMLNTLCPYCHREKVVLKQMINNSVTITKEEEQMKQPPFPYEIMPDGSLGTPWHSVDKKACGHCSPAKTVHHRYGICSECKETLIKVRNQASNLQTCENCAIKKCEMKLDFDGWCVKWVESRKITTREADKIVLIWIIDAISKARVKLGNISELIVCCSDENAEKLQASYKRIFDELYHQLYPEKKPYTPPAIDSEIKLGNMPPVRDSFEGFTQVRLREELVKNQQFSDCLMIQNGEILKDFAVVDNRRKEAQMLIEVWRTKYHELLKCAKKNEYVCELCSHTPKNPCSSDTMKEVILGRENACPFYEGEG